MNKRRSGNSIVANPVLVGAVTTLVVVVAVFLAYNANSGLPFVPTTELKFQVSSGANLLPGNDVREGGTMVARTLLRPGVATILVLFLFAVAAAALLAIWATIGPSYDPLPEPPWERSLRGLLR